MIPTAQRHAPTEGRPSLAQRFEEQRERLLAVAYRMLGSRSEAEDAVQEAWLRLGKSDHDEIENLGAWLATVVARIALNVLRARKTRGETRVPEPLIDPVDGPSPEHAALLADGIGLALLVVLETLSPAERVAFVLHDVFDVPFEQIAPIVERTPVAARQLASRARRRVHARAVPDPDLAVQRTVVDAFLVAARDGDVEGVVAVLDPEVVLRRGDREVRGAEQVARGAHSFSHLGVVRRPVLVNGIAGAICSLDGRPVAVMAFTVRGGKIVEIEILDHVEPGPRS